MKQIELIRLHKVYQYDEANWQANTRKQMGETSVRLAVSN